MRDTPTYYKTQCVHLRNFKDKSITRKINKIFLELLLNIANLSRKVIVINKKFQRQQKHFLLEEEFYTRELKVL